MNVENLIHRRKNEKELTNDEIAKRMTGELGERVSPEGVGHYFTLTAGVKLDKLGAFLASLGLKIVREDEAHVSPDKLAALQTLAKEALHIQGGDSRRSRR